MLLVFEGGKIDRDLRMGVESVNVSHILNR